MKKNVLIILSSTLISCSPFDENRVLEYKDDLNNLVSKIEKYDNGTYDRDEIDEFIIGDIRDLDIDLVVKNSGKKNPNYSGFIEENDSLIIFINRSSSIIDVERRIIYDFNKNPRNFGNDSIIGASYRIIQVDKRWYYSEMGFD
ncbi:hypothetical protein CJ739_3872 [Mariniflexile rhizosphaerae]|uniref:hypothetical protein n=1 Tax=unclassified Mariniflexile TaxID=2643887 RepID=UPI000E32D9BF|nr:hypothetical protein [Mariniflexile sp. TRM1-10]AXP82931.1 hypothetical protein CJ739_3872 [Mariniflexile sp. TRM1-10]